MTEATTLVRLGWFFGEDGALERAVKNYRADFVPVAKIIGKAVKFACWEETPNQYLLMVSCDPTYNPLKHTYNLALTITSEDAALNERVLGEFSGATGIIGLHPPNSQIVQQTLGAVSIVYPVFKRRGRLALQMMSKL